MTVSKSKFKFWELEFDLEPRAFDPNRLTAAVNLLVNQHQYFLCNLMIPL